jgi:hypothetical protein
VRLLQAVRHAHDKQVLLYWNPASPATVGVVWRGHAFPSAPADAWSACRLRDGTERPAAAPKAAATKSKKKQPRTADVVPLEPVVVADDAAASAVSTSAQLLCIAQDMFAVGGGLVKDVLWR